MAQSLCSVVRRDGGYFVQGKFDQLHRPGPYAAVVAAFDDFSQDVLDRGDGEIQRVLGSVEETGVDTGALRALIPQLDSVLGQNNEPDTFVLGDPTSETANRFMYEFRLFLRAIGSPDHLLVCLLDDLHWADEVALDLLSSVVQDDGIRGCVFVITFRDDSNTPTD